MENGLEHKIFHCQKTLCSIKQQKPHLKGINTSLCWPLKNRNVCGHQVHHSANILVHRERYFLMARFPKEIFFSPWIHIKQSHPTNDGKSLSPGKFLEAIILTSVSMIQKQDAFYQALWTKTQNFFQLHIEWAWTQSKHDEQEACPVDKWRKLGPYKRGNWKQLTFL